MNRNSYSIRKRHIPGKSRYELLQPCERSKTIGGMMSAGQVSTKFVVHGLINGSSRLTKDFQEIWNLARPPFGYIL
jgi:hypothetical protein